MDSSGSLQQLHVLCVPSSGCPGHALRTARGLSQRLQRGRAEGQDRAHHSAFPGSDRALPQAGKELSHSSLHPAFALLPWMGESLAMCGGKDPNNCSRSQSVALNPRHCVSCPSSRRISKAISQSCAKQLIPAWWENRIRGLSLLKQEGHRWQRAGAAEGSCSRQVRQPGNRFPSPGSTRTRCSGGAEGTGVVVALGITWWPWE